MVHFIKSKETPLQLERKLQKAGALLGFTKNQVVTSEMVRTRFVELVKASHPDTVDQAPAEMREHTSRYALHTIRVAKDLLLKHMEDEVDEK